MRYIQALLMAVCFSVAAHAQFLALDSATNGGFELGGTPAANGWITVNAAINQWTVSTTTTPYLGTSCAYITNAAPSGANVYTWTSAQTSHMYYDVTIPPSSVNIRLKFYFKGTGQAGADRMMVFTSPTSYTPLINVPATPTTTVTGATNIWTQGTFASTWTPVTVSLPVSLSGSTFRLTFTWQNDATLGANPPAAIDNISVEYNCGVPPAIAGVNTVCNSDSTVLSNSMPGGVWTSSNPAVGTVSPTGGVWGIAQGTTTISYTTGCAAPATKVVTVLATPSPIIGLSDVCVGSTILLTDTAWGSGWGATPGTKLSVDAAGIVTGLIAGVDTVTFDNSCAGGIPVRKVITVRPLPPSILSLTDTLCEAGSLDDTLQLSNSMPGGVWSTLDPTIAVVNPSTGLVTGVTDGTATIRYTSSYGCNMDKVVTVNQLPDPITGVGPVCIGSTIIFSSAWSGGVWSSSLTGVATVTAGIVTGIAGGTTVISYANGCGPVTVIATVDPHPAAIVGPDSVCVGNTATFASATVGGSWSSSFTGVATVLSTSGVITGVVPGLSVISYLMPSGGGCYVTKPIHVVDIPGAISGGMTACPGQTSALANGTPGGVWTSLSPATASIIASGASAGLVTGLIPGTAIIKYTTPAGCVVYTLFTVDPLPEAIVGENEYCAGAKDTLYDPTPDGTWTSVTGGIATITSGSGIMNISATPTSTVTGTVRYTVTSTGCSITKSFVVNPLPVPVVNYNSFTGALSTDTGYTSYQWYHSVKGKLPGAITRKIAATFTGSYTVEVTDKKGCVGVSAPYNFTWTGVGETSAQSTVRIYPNPAEDRVFVDAPSGSRVVLSSLEGKAISDNSAVTTIDISKIPAGVYMISIFDIEGTRIHVEKLVKQ